MVVKNLNEQIEEIEDKTAGGKSGSERYREVKSIGITIRTGQISVWLKP
jgi:hypothetical protein